MKRAVRYREYWMPVVHPTHNNSEAYNPCREGHSDERAKVTDWMNFTYEVCIRCGKNPWAGLTDRRKKARILP